MIASVAQSSANVDRSSLLPSQHIGSLSMDEYFVSLLDSWRTPDFDYVDNCYSSDSEIVDPRITQHADVREKKVVPDDMVADIDYGGDPQFCATFSVEIYMNLRVAEATKRPSTDFMEKVQSDINPIFRAILIDWLVQFAEEYGFIQETLYLRVNYIDRYNVMNLKHLQLLGVACLMIAAKYEQRWVPQVGAFCHMTLNSYNKEEILEMETDVLNYLKFEMTVATMDCFLKRFICAVQGCDAAPTPLLELLACYVAELSLLDYGMLCYRPSIITASSVFLARFLLHPEKNALNTTLSHYTLYNSSELCDCVMNLNNLLCNSSSSGLDAVRSKYSQYKYGYVVMKCSYFPPLVPSEYLRTLDHAEQTLNLEQRVRSECISCGR